MDFDLYLSSPFGPALDEVIQRCPGMKLNILLTMAKIPPNFETLMIRYQGIIRKLALDCGAFSLNNSNLGITTLQLFMRLIAFAKANKERFDLLFSYDPNHDPDSFEENQAYLLELEKEGLPVVPVIHNMQNHEVDTLIQAGYKYVAIGRQQNKTNPNVLIPAVVKLLSHGVLSHLFGITDFNLIVSCPAASCDSKSWLDDANTGVVRFWNPAKPGENKTDILYFPDKQGKTKQGTHVYTQYEYLDEFKRFLGNYGLTLHDMLGLRAGIYRQFLGIIYYRTLEDVVTEIRRKNLIFL